MICSIREEFLNHLLCILIHKIPVRLYGLKALYRNTEICNVFEKREDRPLYNNKKYIYI